MGARGIMLRFRGFAVAAELRVMEAVPDAGHHRGDDRRGEAGSVTDRILAFTARPGGTPPEELLSAGAWVRAPSGGDRLRVLTGRRDVTAAQADTAGFAMAGAENGLLRRHPLTGAEMQAPDGGLLNMNPPRLRSYRSALGPLFTRREAEATGPLAAETAMRLVEDLRGRGTADILRAYAEPFASKMVSAAMGTPLSHRDLLSEYARVAFAVVPGAEVIPQVERAWEGLYGYYSARRWAEGLISGIRYVLAGYTPQQQVHVTGTVSNGFGAMLPVLAVALAEVAQRPVVARACSAGILSWPAIADGLLATRALFPVALPRRAIRRYVLPSGLVIAEGELVLPSLVGAARDPRFPPSPAVAFGTGPHRCPGAALSRVWLTAALSVFFTAFPAVRLAQPLSWQPGTLPMPCQIVLEGL